MLCTIPEEHHLPFPRSFTQRSDDLSSTDIRSLSSSSSATPQCGGGGRTLHCFCMPGIVVVDAGIVV